MDNDRKSLEGDTVGNSNDSNAKHPSNKNGSRYVSFSSDPMQELQEPDKPVSNSSIRPSDPDDDIAALAATLTTNSATSTDKTVEACHSSIFPFSHVTSELAKTEAASRAMQEPFFPTGSKAPAALCAEDAVHSLNSVSTNDAALVDPTAPPWTAEQHRAFVAAIFEVGLKNCSPSVIMENMRKQPKYITRERTKSHLQKYRQTRERSKDDFLTEYDAFLAVTNTAKEAAIASTGREPIPREVLAAALRGKKTSKHGPDQIPYRAVKTTFPVLTEEEKESSLGTSLLFVKGLLHNMTDVLLKARHGISKPLEGGKTDENTSSSSEHEEESSDEEEGEEMKPDGEDSLTNNPKSHTSSGTTTSNASQQARDKTKIPSRRLGYPGPYTGPPSTAPPPISYGPYPHPPPYYGQPMANSMHPPHGPYYHLQHNMNHHMPYGPPPGVIMHPHAQLPPHFGAHSDLPYASYHGPTQAPPFPPGHGSYPTYQSYNNEEYHPYAPSSHQLSYHEDNIIHNSTDETQLSHTADHDDSDSRLEPLPLDHHRADWKESEKSRKKHATSPSTFTSPLIPENRKRRAKQLAVNEGEPLDSQSMFSIRTHTKSSHKSQTSPIQSRKNRVNTRWHHGDSGSPPGNTKRNKLLKRSPSPAFHSPAEKKMSPPQYSKLDTPLTAASAASPLYNHGQSPGMGSDKKNLSPDFFFDTAARFSPSEMSLTSRISHDGHNLTGTWEPLAIDVQEHDFDHKRSRSRPNNEERKVDSSIPGRTNPKTEDMAGDRRERTRSTDSQNRRRQYFFGD